MSTLSWADDKSDPIGDIRGAMKALRTELVQGIAAGFVDPDYRIPWSVDARPYTYPVSRKPYGIAKSRRAARKARNR